MKKYVVLAMCMITCFSCKFAWAEEECRIEDYVVEVEDAFSKGFASFFRDSSTDFSCQLLSQSKAYEINSYFCNDANWDVSSELKLDGDRAIMRSSVSFCSAPHFKIWGVDVNKLSEDDVLPVDPMIFELDSVGKELDQLQETSHCVFNFTLAALDEEVFDYVYDLDNQLVIVDTRSSSFKPLFSTTHAMERREFTLTFDNKSYVKRSITKD